MNNLSPVERSAAGEAAWQLPRHAHIVVYDERDRELLTIYDCGAAQGPPSAQLLGNLVRVKVNHRIRRDPTGYTVTLDEPAALADQGDGHFVIEPRS